MKKNQVLCFQPDLRLDFIGKVFDDPSLVEWRLHHPGRKIKSRRTELELEGESLALR